jgi:hypothetical protein
VIAAFAHGAIGQRAQRYPGLCPDM